MYVLLILDMYPIVLTKRVVLVLHIVCFVIISLYNPHDGSHAPNPRSFTRDCTSWVTFDTHHAKRVNDHWLILPCKDVLDHSAESQANLCIEAPTVSFPICVRHSTTDWDGSRIGTRGACARRSNSPQVKVIETPTSSTATGYDALTGNPGRIYWLRNGIGESSCKLTFVTTWFPEDVCLAYPD